MMRVIFLLLLSSIAFQSNSQTWNNYLQKRFKSYGIWADSILLVPNDTSLNKTGFAIKGSTAYIGDGTKWTAITGGSSVVDSLVYATKANVIKVRDSLLAADNFWSGENRFSNILKVDNQIKVGLESGTTGSIKFYNQVHTNTATIFASDTLATDVDIELPTSSGKLALTTDIAIVDTSIISTKAYVNYKDDIQQGFIDMRKLDADSSADNGYTSRGRLKQYGDSLSASQAVINGVQNDTLNSHKTQILANTNATNTNAANINLKVNIADTLPMLAGYKVASILTSGTLADARLSANVPFKNTANTFTENQTITKTTPIHTLTDANNRSLVATKNETDNNYTLTNQVSEVGGALSNSMNFTSTTGYIEATTTITSLTAWSVSFWIFKGATNGNVLYMSDGTNALNVGFQSGGSLVRIKYNNVTTLYSTSTTTSGWAHYVVMKTSGGSLACYQNNTLLTNSGSGVVTNISSITKIRIGDCTGQVGASSESGALVNQRLDQVVLYNKILSVGEIGTIWTSSTGTNSLPATGNILLRYEFNEGIGSITQDLSGNNYTGTLFNTATWSIANGKIPTEATYQNAFLQRSRDGIYTGNRGESYFGDPFGGTWISGRTIKFTRLDETVASLISGEDGNILISPNNTTLSAIPLSPLTVVGNSYFGTNTAATARVHIAASSTSASGGQLKLTSGGSRQSTPENGTINNVANNLEFVDGGVVYILAKTLKATSTLDFGSIASLSTSTLTVTLTGAADGDLVYIGVPSAAYTAGLIFTARVSATDTVSIDCYNSTLSDIDPASASFKISIVK